MNKNKINKLSVEILKPLVEFDNHFMVVNICNKEVQLDAYVAIHKKNKDLPSFGATRFWSYPSKKDGLRDALRLGKLMSYKSALAGLPYGGAKAVIVKPKGKFSRTKLLKAYAEGLNELGGIFVTGTDVGLTVADLEGMKKYTKHLVGYVANPEKATGLGVAKSLDAALIYNYKDKKYSKYSFAIQGVGKVGTELLKILIKGGAKDIFVSDIDKKRLKQIKKEYPLVKIVPVDKIHKQKVDVFCPCALSGVINKKSIKDLKCKIIVGSANNQLAHDSIGKELHQKEILYCPDYVVNAGGLISVTDEYVYGASNDKRLNKKIDKIASVLNKIFNESKKSNLPPYIVSQDIGLSIINKNSLK
jgi:leucine dehydrogenase